MGTVWDWFSSNSVWRVYPKLYSCGKWWDRVQIDGSHETGTYMKPRKSKVGQVLAGGIGGSKLRGMKLVNLWPGNVWSFSMFVLVTKMILGSGSKTQQVGTKTKLFTVGWMPNLLQILMVTVTCEILHPENDSMMLLKIKAHFSWQFQVAITVPEGIDSLAILEGEKLLWCKWSWGDVDDKRTMLYLCTNNRSLMNLSKILSEKRVK